MIVSRFLSAGHEGMDRLRSRRCSDCDQSTRGARNTAESGWASPGRETLIEEAESRKSLEISVAVVLGKARCARR